MRLKIAGWQDNLLHRGYWWKPHDDFVTWKSCCRSWSCARLDLDNAFVFRASSKTLPEVAEALGLPEVGEREVIQVTQIKRQRDEMLRQISERAIRNIFQAHIQSLSYHPQQNPRVCWRFCTLASLPIIPRYRRSLLSRANSSTWRLGYKSKSCHISTAWFQMTRR